MPQGRPNPPPQADAWCLCLRLGSVRHSQPCHPRLMFYAAASQDSGDCGSPFNPGNCRFACRRHGSSQSDAVCARMNLHVDRVW
jgi:hypothetical protein